MIWRIYVTEDFQDLTNSLTIHFKQWVLEITGTSLRLRSVICKTLIDKFCTYRLILLFSIQKSDNGNTGSLNFNHSSCSEQAYCETHMDYEFNIDKETWETTMVNMWPKLIHQTIGTVHVLHGTNWPGRTRYYQADNSVPLFFCSFIRNV